MLGEGWGCELDAAGASFAQMRWVAGPGRHRLAEVERRYVALLALLSSGGGHREWKAMRDSVRKCARGDEARADVLDGDVIRVPRSA
jgi:hypothetical protein